MAVTIAELIEDIEKRMTALGYEDLEELHGIDHDIDSLKQLKRRLMDEAKALREYKKEKTKWTKEFRDVLVKLSKVYKKDLYLYNGNFAIPGKISEESLKGKFILILKDEFVPCVKHILYPDNKNTMLFIRDISELKNIVDENLMKEEVILPTALERHIVGVLDDTQTVIKKDNMDLELEEIKRDSEFFINLEIDNDPDILNYKKIFKMKYKDYPPIEGNIQLFPFYTEKDTPEIEFMCGDFVNKGSMTLYFARFHVDYQYFDIHFKIYFF